MRKQLLILVLVLAATCLLPAGRTGAQSGGGYDLTWNLAGGSGGAMSGGAYTLEGSVGQSDAGLLSGGGYTLNGGFWNNPPEYAHKVYLPVIVKP